MKNIAVVGTGYVGLVTGTCFADLGNKITCHSIPIRPGRNLAIIVETTAVNHRQKKMGYNAAEELYKRVQANFTRKRNGYEE